MGALSGKKTRVAGHDSCVNIPNTYARCYTSSLSNTLWISFNANHLLRARTIEAGSSIRATKAMTECTYFAMLCYYAVLCYAKQYGADRATRQPGQSTFACTVSSTEGRSVEAGWPRWTYESSGLSGAHSTAYLSSREPIHYIIACISVEYHHQLLHQWLETDPRCRMWEL